VRKPTRAIKLPKPTTLRLLRILQDTGFVSREPLHSWKRASRAFETLGVLMTNTCINYQTTLPPT
jgi:DNA-binding IclR family transcriptional regulator